MMMTGHSALDSIRKQPCKLHFDSDHESVTPEDAPTVTVKRMCAETASTVFKVEVQQTKAYTASAPFILSETQLFFGVGVGLGVKTKQKNRQKGYCQH